MQYSIGALKLKKYLETRNLQVPSFLKNVDFHIDGRIDKK